MEVDCCARDEAQTSRIVESHQARRKLALTYRVQEKLTLTSKALLRRLHPRLAGWFGATFADFTDAQLRCVPAILERASILLTSPTGSGKTLAAFLGVFDQLLRELDAGTLSLGVQCLYVSPLRALSYYI